MSTSRRQSKSTRFLIRLSVLVTVVAVMAACGSTDPSAKADNDATDSGVAAIAAQRTKAFTAHSGAMPVVDPVKVAPGKKTFVYIQCLQVICKQVGDALQIASDAVGAELIRLAVQDTPASVQQAAVTALQHNPTAVFDGADPTEWFSEQLAEMNKRKIPVIAWSLPGGFKDGGLSANLLPTDQFYFAGVLMADWVASEGGAGSHSLMLNLPDYPVLATLAKGYNDEMKKVCPTCKVVTSNFTIQDVISGGVSSTTVASLQRDPKISHIVGSFGGLITKQLAQAVKGAGFSKVRAVSQSGTSANYQLIQSGDFQVADLSVPGEFLAWRGLDTVFRTLAGQDPKAVDSFTPALAKIAGHPDVLTSGVPQQWVTKAQVPGGTINDAEFDKVWLPVKNYQAEFKKLWGVN
jgi:ribose transport system substrate-binding protein